MGTAAPRLRSVLAGPAPWRQAGEVAACAQELAGTPGGSEDASVLAAQLDAAGFRRSALLLRLSLPDIGADDADGVARALASRRGPATRAALRTASAHVARSLAALLEATERLGRPVARARVLASLAEALAGRPELRELGASALAELERERSPERLASIPLLLACVDERTRPRLLRQARDDLLPLSSEDAPRRSASLLSALPAPDAQEMGLWIVRELEGARPLLRARTIAALGPVIGPPAMARLAESTARDARALDRLERDEAFLLLVEGMGDEAPPAARDGARAAVEGASPPEAASLLARLALSPLSDESLAALVERCVAIILSSTARMEDPWSRAEVVRGLLEVSAGCSEVASLAVLDAAVGLGDPELVAHVLRDARSVCASRPALAARAAGVSRAALARASAIPDLARRLEVLRDLGAAGAADEVRAALAPSATGLAREAAAVAEPWERMASLGILASLVGPDPVRAAVASRLDALREAAEAIGEPWPRLDAALAILAIDQTPAAEDCAGRAVDAMEGPLQRARALARVRERLGDSALARRLVEARLPAICPPEGAAPDDMVAVFDALIRACDGLPCAAAVLEELDRRAPDEASVPLPALPSAGAGPRGPWGALSSAGLPTPPPAGNAAGMAAELLPASCMADEVAARLLVEGEVPDDPASPEAAGIVLLSRADPVNLPGVIAAAEVLGPRDEGHPLSRLAGYLGHCRDVMEGRSPPDPCRHCPAPDGCELRRGRALLASVPSICEAPGPVRGERLRALGAELRSIAGGTGTAPPASLPSALDALDAHLRGERSEEEALISLIDLLLFPPDCVQRMKSALARAGAARALRDARRALSFAGRRKGALVARRSPGSEDLRAIEPILEAAGQARALAQVRCLRRVLDAEARALLLALQAEGRQESYERLSRVALAAQPTVQRRRAVLGALDAPSLAAIGRRAHALASLDAAGELTDRAVASALGAVRAASRPAAGIPPLVPPAVPFPLPRAVPPPAPAGPGAGPRPPEGRAPAARPATVRPGYSYLVVENRPDASFAIIATASGEGVPSLCISRTNPDILRRRYSLPPAIAVRWLTDDQVIDRVTLGPSHIDTVQAITSFLNEHPRALVLLDGMEYLVSRNGFDSMLRAVQSLRDRVSLGEASLLVTLSRYALGERELTLLQRELEPLGPGAAGGEPAA